MEIITANSAGFCFGVKRAVECVYEQLKINDINNDNNSIYTYGPIIHNENVVNDLNKKGVKVIEGEQELKNIKTGTVIIRSHGVSKHIYDIISENGLKLIDATCPFVKKIHRIVDEKSSQGMEIVIIGNDKHPEVEGIKGWSFTKTTVIGNELEAEKFIPENGKKICIVSQTTFNYNKFNNLVEIIKKNCYNSIIVNTICNATNERQVEAMKIAGTVDAMLVIGGLNSSNSQKLYEICKNECKNTYFIQTAEDLKTVSLAGCRKIGITAGASTPNNIIEEVRTNVRIKF